MKPLIIALLPLIISLSANAQTPIVEKNIKDCFKKSARTPASFDYCVAEEFRRAREEKAYREARIKAGKDPDGGCAKPTAHKECFEEIMLDLKATSDRLYSGSGYSGDYYYLPRIPFYRYRWYYPSRYYPRTYYPRYYPRTYVSPFRTYRRY